MSDARTAWTGLASGALGLLVGGMVGAVVMTPSGEEAPSEEELVSAVETAMTPLRERLDELREDLDGLKGLRPELPELGEARPSPVADLVERPTDDSDKLLPRLEEAIERLEELPSAIASRQKEPFEPRTKRTDRLADLVEGRVETAANGFRGLGPGGYEALQQQHFGRTRSEIVARYGIPDVSHYPDQWTYYLGEVPDLSRGETGEQIVFYFKDGVVVRVSYGAK